MDNMFLGEFGACHPFIQCIFMECLLRPWQGDGGLGWSVGKEHNGKEKQRKPLEEQRGRWGEANRRVLPLWEGCFKEGRVGCFLHC